MTEESAVKVCVRVRPLVAREENATSENAVPVQLFWKADKKSIHQIDDGNSTKSFSFDRVFTSEETTSQLYQNIAKPLVVSTVAGYNGTIFAYGQTSSGKTFTMMGSDHMPGVIPLAVEDVFQTIKSYPKKEFLLRVSYMEIYNETVTDLLVDSWKRKPLEIRETINKNIYVADLTEELVTSPAQALAWIRKGEKNRHYGKTKMNQRSSRSHTIFRMILESREGSDPVTGENADGAIIVSHLNLVDLAGSERASQTGAEGARFKEGCNINRSLFILGQVIKKLTDENQKGFTNYRDSKLTRILQNSLGGNAKTVIICTITAAALDETLSTLQFASTAKKMKNDPHVTEVSDDGALLKRYRNEIVDLKRRLQEVSSVTQTTATEKEVLSQLLQEKDQLQREQEDRIKNLTKLLVTSSNLVPVHKIRKRRVTWGGKMVRLSRPSTCGDESSNLSFADPWPRKRKADRSCLMELGEEEEDFDSHWGIPEEPSDDMDISQSSVTVRSFGDSPRDFVSPDRMRELTGKVSNLEMQLEMESQQKEEAMAKAETLEERVAELQLQLETEAQQRQETLEKILTTEQKAAELELQLEAGAQQKLEAMEKVEMLELRVADLERQLEEQSHNKTETDEQMRKEFAETIQLCETLATEKDMVVVERDYLKQELGMFIEQTETLEKEKAALSQELEEKREMDEFNQLEEEIKRENEDELQNEISSLKKAVEASELQCLELQNKLDVMSEKLKKKTEFAEELQNMNGKDLVQEVAKLRRSLDDAEGLSRDTKKEWAVLRSQKISLEETNVTLTANHERMEAEVNSLRFQLETEKTRFKKMQTDLQKELNVAFDENTKLTTLLDGKVPKNLIDSVELERTVASLNKELAASHEAEETLRAQLEELASFKTLPDQVDSLMKQVCELTEELHAAQTQKDNLLSVQAQCQEEALQLRNSWQTSQDEIMRIQADLSAAALRETELRQQCAEVTQQLDSLHSELERHEAEKSELMASMEERSLKLEESDQLRASLEGKLNEMQQMIKDLEEKFADSEVSRATEEEINKELQDQLNQLNEELRCAQAEKDTLLSEQSAGVQSSAEETEKLLSTVTSLTAEIDQLRMNLQEHEEKAGETERLLESLQDELLQQKQKNSDLIQVHEQKESDFSERMVRLSQELQCVRDEMETHQMAATQHSPAEVESLLSTVASLTAERDQLKMDLQENVDLMIENQEDLRTALENNRKQKEQIKQLVTAQTPRLDGPPNDMSSQLEELQTQMETLTKELQSVRTEKDDLLSEKERNTRTSTEEMEKLLSRVTSLTEERDQLQEILEGLREEKKQLGAELENKMESLHNKMETLTQKLQIIEAERDSLLSEKDSNSQSSTEEMEKLLFKVTSLTEERDQLQEILEGLREEKKQLRAELEERMEMVAEAQTGFYQPEMMTLDLQAHDEKVNQLQQEIELLQATLQAITEQKKQAEDDLQRSNEMVTETQSLVQSLQEQIQEQNERNLTAEGTSQEGQAQLEQQTKTLAEELESARAEINALLFEKEASRQTYTDEMEKLLCRVTSLSEERDQLQETLEGLRQEKKQLSAELEDKMEMMQCDLQQQLSSEPHSLKEEQETQRLLQIQQLEELLEKTKEEVTQLESDRQENVELMIENQAELRASQEKIRALQEEIDMLRSEKAELESRASSGNDADSILQIQELKDQIQRLTEELENMRAERDSLLSEKEADIQTSTEEMEKLQCRVTSLSEERDQLQEILEGLREEKKQLSAELEDQMASLQTETVNEHKRQMEDDLQHNVNMRSSTEELLQSVQEELQQQKNINSDLEKLNREKEVSFEEQIKNLTEKLEIVEAERNCLQTSTEEKKQLLSRVTSLSEERDQLQELLESLKQEKKQLSAELEDRMASLQAEIRTLTQKLQITEAERDSLLSEKERNTHTSKEEMEELQCRVTSLSEERNQLQEILEGLREEKKQLSAELEEKMEMISAIQTKLNQQEQLNVLQQSESEEREVKMQQEVQKLEDQMQAYKERQAQAKAEAEASQQLLSEANTTISALREHFNASQQSAAEVKEMMSSQLQNSTDQLQESFGRFQHFINTCSKYNSAALENALRVQCSLKSSYLTVLPKPTIDAYAAVRQQGQATVQSLIKTQEELYARAQRYREMFKELVKKDLAVFEERRLQDTLLCRAQAPAYSVKDEDQTTWEHRLPELLDKRQLYLQKMASVLEKLETNLASYVSGRRAEIREREKFKEQLQASIAHQPDSFSWLDGILSQELERRSAVTQSWKMRLQGITDEQNSLFTELKQLEHQADSQLREEKSKNSTLLQALEGAPLKTEVSLLKDNQQLLLQLQQAEEKVKALCVQNEQLEDAQIKANNRVSTHKHTTQLLQTELQDSRALVEEKENAIQALKSKLRDSEKKAPPTAVELEKLQAKLLKMEVQLTSASDEHQQEMQRMTMLLNEKESSLRKLKETLRKSQQQGEDSFLQGKDLHARLTNPRGLVTSSIQLEKAKLEEEVKELRLKITELESLVSSQQAELSKWKSRAIKLKGKSKAEVDKPSSPCTPTKRAFPMTSDSSHLLSSPKKCPVAPKKNLDSPRKALESPRKLLDSPKSGFFNIGGSSELLSRTCPKKFFDNSSLGIIPDAVVGANKTEEWWPQSPKQEEMCKTQ
ncbi:centromere-associated protein E isoform X2 [Acanthochromis polyacanthus]|uniref:centromere-associated protein E isoform X2 n=1 Tax=Acanthochromis polyacanthus TaxID=80966 RepID=UPI00223457E5|nr:centromere-associated protein E isoform X2 [Acanthochromis polyacanthus]